MRKTISFFAVGAVLASIAISCKTRDFNTDSEVKEAPTGDNEDKWFGLQPMRYDVVNEAALKTPPWPGDYWANYRGGIGYRWRKPQASGENYKAYFQKLPTAEQIKAMSEAEIALLSPAEKYDIWMGRYDLTATSTVSSFQRALIRRQAELHLKSYNEDKIPSWTGICNGWSLAALREPQPKEVVKVKNAAGQTITFYPDDIKGLTSRIYFDYEDRIVINRVGSSCAPIYDKDGKLIRPVRNNAGKLITDADGRPTVVDCRDVNAGTFHKVLGQYINNNKPFVYDRVGSEEIWNQPVVGYRATKLGEPRALDASYKHAAPGTKYLVDYKTTLEYVTEAAHGTGYISKDKISQFVRSDTYFYTLELDGNYNVIGGEWKVNSPMPDFLWKPEVAISQSVFEASYPLSYSKVKELITASTSETVTPADPIPTVAPTAAADSTQTITPPANANPATNPTNTVFVSVVSSGSQLASTISVLPVLKTGIKTHTDSGVVITKVGANLAGSNIILLQNANFSSNAQKGLVFRSSKNATVFVGVDKRMSSDKWLTNRGFSKVTEAGYEVATNYVLGSPLVMYKKAISAATDVVIPGQNVDGDVGLVRNYVVIVRD